jgi:PAS domain S-box-containing protein
MDVSTQIPVEHNSSHNQRFAEMFAAAAIGIAICDLDGRIQEANPTLARMLGYGPDTMAGLNLWNLPIAEASAHTGADQKFGPASLDGLVLGEHDHLTIDHRLQQRGGSEFWGCLTFSLARDLHHQPAFIVALLEDASDRKRTEDELRQAEKMEVSGGWREESPTTSTIC